MRPLLLSPVIAVLFWSIGGVSGAFAQSPPEPADSAPLLETPSLKAPTLPAWWGGNAKADVAKADVPKSPDWLSKHVSIEIFGYDPKVHEPGFELSPGYTSAMWYNLHDLECPRCVMPVTRTRFTIPPSGVDATLKLLGGRVQLFGGFGALEALKPAGTFEPQGLRLMTSSDDDAWLVQIKAGARVAVDPHRHLWLGGTARHLYNFGSGKTEWSTLSGDATFKFGR